MRRSRLEGWICSGVTVGLAITWPAAMSSSIDCDGRMPVVWAWRCSRSSVNSKGVPGIISRSMVHQQFRAGEVEHASTLRSQLQSADEIAYLGDLLLF